MLRGHSTNITWTEICPRSYWTPPYVIFEWSLIAPMWPWKEWIDSRSSHPKKCQSDCLQNTECRRIYRRVESLFSHPLSWTAGPKEPGGHGGTDHPPKIFSYPVKPIPKNGGQVMPHHIFTRSPGFSNLPTVLDGEVSSALMSSQLRPLK